MVTVLPKTYKLALDRAIGGRKIEPLIRSVNRALPDDEMPLDEDQLHAMRTNPHANSYGEGTVIAIADALAKGKDAISPEEREHLIEAGQRAIRDHRRRLERDWRKTNPPGLKNKPSIHEMIEETFQDGGTLKDLFAKVAENWATDDKRFIPTRMHEHCTKEIGKEKAPTRDALAKRFYRAETPIQGKGLKNVNALCEAFNISGTQRTIFFRLTSGEKLDVDEISDMAESLIEDPHNQKVRHNFMHSLHNATGLSTDEVGDLVGTKGHVIRRWLEGRHCIQDTQVAQKLSELYMPNILPHPKKYILQTRALVLGALTGKPLHLTLDQVIEESKKQPNPKIALFGHIFTKNSVFGISTKEAAQQLNKGLSWIKHHMRDDSPTSEDVAKQIAKMVGASPKQAEEIVEIITKIPSPKKLVIRVKNGEMRLNAALTLMRERKLWRQSDLKRDGLNARSISVAECEGTTFGPRTAVIYADAFFKQSERKTPEYQYFVSMLTGREALTQEDIIRGLNEERIEPRAAIEHLLALKGHSFNSFFKSIGTQSGLIPIKIEEMRVRRATAQTIADFIGCDVKDLEIISRNSNRREPGNIRPFQIREPVSSVPAYAEDDGGSLHERLGLHRE